MSPLYNCRGVTASRDNCVDDLVEGVKQEVKVSADLLDPPRL